MTERRFALNERTKGSQRSTGRVLMKNDPFSKDTACYRGVRNLRGIARIELRRMYFAHQRVEEYPQVVASVCFTTSSSQNNEFIKLEIFHGHPP